MPNATKRRAAVAPLGPAGVNGTTSQHTQPTNAWDRARRAFAGGDGPAHVSLNVCAGSRGWDVLVDLSPDPDGEGMIRVHIFGGELEDPSTYWFAESHGVGFHCKADELEKLGHTILEAARGLKELTRGAGADEDVADRLVQDRRPSRQRT